MAAQGPLWSPGGERGVFLATDGGATEPRGARAPSVLEIDPRFHKLRSGLLDLEGRFVGPRSKAEPGEKAPPTVGDRLFAVSRGVGQSTYGPTASHRQSLEIATREMAGLREALERTQAGLSELVRQLIAAGGPWIEGEPLP